MDEIKKSGQPLAENVVYSLLWLVVFMVTVVGFGSDGVIQWRELGRFWLRAAPFFLLFLLNNYILLPRFFLKKRYGMYVGLALLAILIVTAFHVVMFRQKKNRFPPHGTIPGEGPRRELVQLPPESPPGERSGGYEFRPLGPPRPFHLKWGLVLDKALLALLMVGFNIAIKLIFKMSSDSRIMEILEKQNLQAELDYLKVQINPHFFMNTLNNIHALVDIDREKAKETIIELSKIMRYVLYETDKPMVAIAQEIRFLDNYISLMRIRFADKVSIECRYPEVLPEGKIPPLMLLTLTENAFKHGISYRKDSYIKTSLTVQGERLLYTVVNSIQENGVAEKNRGVGLENLRKRLSLLYGDNYQLKLITRNGEHTALLEIPIEK